MKNALIALVVIVLLAGGYYALSKKPSPSTKITAGPADISATPTANSSGTVVKKSATLSTMTDPNLGTYLAAQNGMTLYKYTKDTPGASVCSGQCAINWPPYTVTDAASISAESAVKGKLATIKREDGTLQVTYNDMPLYYWIKDAKPGDTTGQNVGGVWFVVNP